MSYIGRPDPRTARHRHSGEVVRAPPRLMKKERSPDSQRTPPSAIGPLRGMPAFILEKHLFYLFGQALGRRDRSLARALAPFGLTVSRWRVLAALHARPGSSLTKLAEITAVDRTTAMRTVEHMRRDGIVDRAADPADRRSSLLALTRKGEALFAKIFTIVAYHNRRAITGLSEQELEIFVAQLQRIIANLPAQG